MNHSATISTAAEFCGDDELGYQRSRTRFTPGAGLALDEAYRLAHLPLVAPRHPRVIPRREGTSYDMGRHERVYSLVLPVPGQALRGSEAYRELERDVMALPFSGKIAWDAVAARRDKLHATIAGSLGVGPEPPRIEVQHRRALAELGPLPIELRGLFSGNVNVGRLYLRAYPARRNGSNAIHAVQRALGRAESDLYVVGLYNLTDDLDAAEAAALAELIERWWDRPILHFEADHLWLLGSTDDLVLDSTVAEIIPLVP
jgi:hypothetical protein